jgi:hypothetical protein
MKFLYPRNWKKWIFGWVNCSRQPKTCFSISLNPFAFIVPLFFYPSILYCEEIWCKDFSGNVVNSNGILNHENELQREQQPTIDILTRTYYKDGDILVRNLITTLNLFVNREIFKFGVVLDDESDKDHHLGNELLQKKFVDYVRYEALPPNHLTLFQALAFYPSFSWGYDRQQWSTFYMDLHSNSDIIGLVDSDSTFTTYLTYENVLTEDGRIRLHVITPLASWHNWLFPFGDGSQYCNDKIALGFNTPYDTMNTNRMPMFFWRSTFINLRNYISKLYNTNFDEAFRIFSRNRYCQFNILVNYAIKFEPEKYVICDQCDRSANLMSVSQNGCPNTRDILIGGIKSFNIYEDELPKRLQIRGHAYATTKPLNMLNACK